MDVSMVTSPQRRQRPILKLLVFGDDAVKYNDIFTKLQKDRNVKVIFYDSYESLRNEDDATFFCGDFSSALFRQILPLKDNQVSGSDAPQRLVVGPGALRHRLEQGSELMSLRMCRPLYCEIMRNITMVISAEVKNKRHLVELVHCMGGSVRKEPMNRTNVLIANRAACDFWGSVSALGQKALRADWIKECWEHRDDPNFDVFDKKLVEKHVLAVFEGLNVYFHGFKRDDMEDMIKNLEENKGTAVADVTLASHIVYNSSAADIDPLPMVREQQKQVTQEWLWVSLTLGKCASEEPYALPTRTLRKMHMTSGNSAVNSPVGKSSNSKSTSSMRGANNDDESTSLNATPDYIYSNDDVENVGKSPRPLSKRMQVCFEMHETEANYLNALKLLLKFQKMLESEIAQNEFVKRTDIAYIFGKLEPVIKVHEKISARLSQLAAEAMSAHSSMFDGKKYDDKNADFATIWIESKAEMMKVYPAYLNSYDSAKQMFDAIDRENAKFHAFCKAKESNPDFKRQKVIDLLVRPVQRLPSVILLLKEMAKKSETSKLKSSAEEAVKVVDDVLKFANKAREKTDHLINHLAKFNDIEQVPIDLMAADRMFICETTVTPIRSTIPKLNKPCRMIMFLLHDTLLIAKVREDKKGTMQRLARHASFASLHARRRPYKYLQHIPLNRVRNASRVRASQELKREVCSINPNWLSREPSLWILTFRCEGDDLWLFETPQSSADQAREFFENLDCKMMSEFGRMLMSEEVYSDDLPANEIEEAAEAHFRKRMVVPLNSSAYERTPRHESWSGTGTAAENGPSPKGKMRRAFSNAQLTIQATFGFGRAVSRANLGQINENSPVVSMTPQHSDEPSSQEQTPRRTLRARLTSSTFLNRTLNRNRSVRNMELANQHQEDHPDYYPSGSSRVTDV